MIRYTDQELIERVLAGEREYFAVLVRRYQENFYRHAFGMLRDRDAAADIVQDAFVKAYVRLKKCHDRSKFRAWMLRILRNACFDYLKQPRRKDVSLEQHAEALTVQGGPDTDLDRSSLQDVLNRALGRLPAAQREAFLLKHVQELSYEEMTEVVGASVSALRMRVKRARELLQTLLAEENGPARAQDVIRDQARSSYIRTDS